jgi:magnesium transporter
MVLSMAKLISKRSKKSGLSPGSLVHIGEQKIEKTRITVIDYDGDNFLEKKVQTVEECFPFRETSTVTWINIDGIHDAEVVEKLGGYFGLHPLILEDIMNTSQRPKMEDLGDAIYIVLKMIEIGNDRPEVTTEQMSLAFGRNFVLSFQERPGDTFDPVRERIRRGKGRIRKMGPDYLAYALIDAIVDDYFLVLEKQGEQIECLEDELIANPKQETLHGLHTLKRDMIFVRKSVWPLREVISRLERAESPLIQKTTGIFLRDVYDHTIQVIDNIETYREMLSGMLDTYLSSLSNRMNEVMKTLTIIATIFIPLTFLAGVYGMNFKFMPELNWRGGYFLVWGVMLAVGVFMVFYFKRKKWF